ncbi:MAG TPA: ATP-dependent zinc metalloprotease FtsH [Rhizomicrobium sp.]|nr:ATP-dependent zinc metalloprotease FtsH [Rhizomicrobium sp.]
MNPTDKRKKSEKQKQPFAFDILYLVGAVVLILLLRTFWSTAQTGQEIPYSQFQDWLAAGKVSDLIVGDKTIAGTYKPDQKSKPRLFSTTRVDREIATDLRNRHIKFTGEPQPGLIDSFLSWLLPTAGLILFWLFLLRPMLTGFGGGAGGLMAIGRSRAKVYAEKDVKVTFADVAGVDEAKQELAEVVGFLKDPGFYGRLGARVPKGVLLVGPPGTGKTLLARAVAGEANVPFLSITGSEFVEMFVGVGAARVRDLFEQARAQAPAIIFIDELDALGRARGIDVPIGGHDEKEQTLNQLLAEMDGFDPSMGIIVLAATNRPEILDPALLRAGRFDRQVLVDRPDRKGRLDILRVHIKKIRIAPDLNLDAVAGLTPGFTGADLANLVNEAAMVATRRKADATTLDDFTQAIERVVAGLEKKSRILTPHERKVVAHHEMGHALVAMALPGTDPVQKVSIIPRGMSALGYTMQRPLEDRFLQGRSELVNRLSVLLGGRAAELLVFSEASTGAADDLARATDIARDMVVRFGMSDELGPVTYEPERTTFLMGQTRSWQPKSYGEATAQAIDEAVKKLVEDALHFAKSILETNSSVLEEAASSLLAHETLSGNELQPFAARLTMPTPLRALPEARIANR